MIMCSQPDDFAIFVQNSNEAKFNSCMSKVCNVYSSFTSLTKLYWHEIRVFISTIVKKGNERLLHQNKQPKVQTFGLANIEQPSESPLEKMCRNMR